MNTLIKLLVSGAAIWAANVSAQGSGSDAAARADAGQGNAGSPLAAEAAYPYYTSDPYGRQPSFVFPDSPADYRERFLTARSLRRADNGARAAPILEELVREYQDDSATWYQLGMCQADLGEHEEAIHALRNALTLGVTLFDAEFAAQPSRVMVKIGWLYAEIGDVEESLFWLRRGLEARFTSRPQLARAPEAARFRGNAEFAALAGIAPAGSRSRDEQWRYDIEFLHDQVALLHFDPDHHTPAVELERYLQELSDAVPRLTDEEIVARLSLFMGRLGAGHDALVPAPSDPGAPSPFALRAYFFTDGLYVIEAEDELLVGARIDAFGETPTRSAFEIVASAIARDNNMTARLMAPSYLMNALILDTLGIVDEAASATLTITDRDGRVREVSPARGEPFPISPALVPPPTAEAPLYLSRQQSPYWTKFLDEHSALYVQLNAIFDDRDEDFASFARRVRREAADPAVRHIIFDVRHSLGGMIAVTPELARALIHFDASPDKGDLFVIIGRNTYSATQLLITDLDRLAEPVFVGEPSGSRPSMLGETGEFALPFSGLSGYLSAESYQASWPQDHRIWIAPHVPVGLSSEDFFSGRDPALAAVAELIGASE